MARNRRSFSAMGIAAILALLAGLAGWLTDWTAVTGKQSSAVVSDGGYISGGLQIDVLAVGNADCILVTCDGKSLLIDAGERDDGERIVRHLQARGIASLDTVIATHFDVDHIGGMEYVLRSVRAERIIMAFMPEGYEPTTVAYMKLLEAIDELGLEITPALPGDLFDIGGAEAEILGPVLDFTEKNNQSVVCRVTYGRRKFLFMGDAEKKAETALLGAGTDLSADVVKLGHHGSRTSSTEGFLRRVNPTLALLSCGTGNSYGHPHPETLAILQELEIPVLRTDLRGDLTITSDGTDIAYYTER